MKKNPFDALWGNEKLKNFFRCAIDDGSLAHAYILEGEDGTGKHTLTKAIAEYMAGDGPEGERVAKNISPDVQYIGIAKDKKTITVDAVRRIKGDAYIKPADLPFKMYIIEEADKMNVQAQNAALKLLEEPPGECYFFLLCTTAAALLPTVRSRAPVMRMMQFSNEELIAFLKSKPEYRIRFEKDPELLKSCVKNSMGSPGRAMALLGEKEREKSKEQAKELLCAMEQPSLSGILTAVYRLPAKRQELEEVIGHLAVAFRDMLLVRSGVKEGGLLFFRTEEEAEKAAEKRTRQQMTALYEQCCILTEQLERNMNVQNARMALATGIYQVIG